MSVYVLGLSCFYHDASAALIKDGRVVAAAAEERFTRLKHDISFPLNAIAYCLESQSITIKDVQAIGFYEKPLLKFERILYQNLEMFPLGLIAFLTSLPSWINKKLRVIKIIRKKLKYGGDVFFIPHHLAHAASSFLISPFQKSAILTVDGVGEWTTTAFGIGEGNHIRLLKEIRFPSSLGLFYSAITAYLGFRVNDSEYKVMGLSAYGSRDREKNYYYEKLRKVVDVKEDGSYRLDMSYFVFHYSRRMPSRKLCRLLGGGVRRPSSPILERHKDIAAALQMILEEVIFKMLHHVYRVTGCDQLILSGGVALNSVCNGKILKNTPFGEIWIQPDAGDGGAGLGAAAYVYYTLMGYKRKYVMKEVYLGPEFSAREIEYFLDRTGVRYHRFKSTAELIKTTAKLIYENNVVGWFQGRMEWGPRALGARSILANSCNPKMRDILNIKVKHREEFRPFAPVVLRGEALKYFDGDRPIPDSADFMLMVYPIREWWQKKLPSVTHVDGSGRLQTIERANNPLYYDVVKEFGKLSGIPILINTSFNVQGEPIVCTPEDAYKCLMKTEIDYLVMDRFLIARKDNFFQAAS